MTNETKKRIQAYKKALPGMKERVFTALILLIIATTIGVSTTFAWVTLSKAPAVASVATTLAANGSLEIALAHGTGSELPSDADIDESVARSSDVLVTNLTWGNLINVSDSRYGIDDLVLRPAQLNTASLSSSPLWGAVYGSDGRITKLDSKYTYTKWNGSEFLASPEKGVRAIASYYTATSSENAAEYELKYQAVMDAHMAVNEYYKNNIVTSTTMSGLGNAVGTYLQSKLNEKGYGTSTETNLAMTTAEVRALLNVYEKLMNAIDLEKDALVVLANHQQYIYAKEHEITYSEFAWNDLVSGKETYDTAGTTHKKEPTKPTEAIAIKGLKTFISNYTTAQSDYSLLEELYKKSNSGQTVYSNDIDTPVSHICNASACLIDGKTVSQWMNGSKWDLLGLTSGDHLIKVSGGILAGFEQMAVDPSYRLPESKSTQSNAATVKASGKYVITLNINMTGHICTSASGNSYFMDDFGSVPSDINTADKIAEDTYGMAVDFWVRTNYEQMYLTLEGAIVADTDGTILRYDGINRIWGATGNTALTTNSTTQGGGSCYVYYADSPEDMSRSLDLLNSMKVAFVSQDGDLLATAAMDTKHYLSVNGRVVVPLAISNTESIPYTATDENGNDINAYAITYMKLDEAQMITAVVYLDGATLTNTQVLAAGDIQGQLNLQFGSSELMTTVGDNKLLTAERSVSATVSKNTFNYDTAESDEDLKTTVTLTMDGTDPDASASVTAFFVRAVNSTQGKREETMTFTKQANGTWTADYAFNLPGTYYLRYVRINRVDYALEDAPMVTVSGFGISSVSWSEGLMQSAVVYSANTSYEESIAVQFQTTDVSRMPSSVQARFIRDDGNAVSVDTTYNSATGKWEGRGVFIASGNYTLSYLVIDGSYFDISSFRKDIALYLGLSAVVYNHNSPLNEEYDADSPDKVYNRNVQVAIVDNAGNRIDKLENTRLYYANGGSSTNGVDTDLSWNEVTGYYEGTLPITKAGRYVFASLQVGSNILTKATEAPKYVVVPPDAPKYDTTSKSNYNGDDIQFIPLQNNATLGPIKISDSAAAQISAVIYNDRTKEYYEIPMASTATQKGTLYYVSSNGGYWMINLPECAGNQDGTWSVVAIKAWECFDGSVDVNYLETEEDAIVWVGNSSVAGKYAADHSLTADKTVDFSKLSTTVSCTVNIAMEAGTTKLGDKNTDFMTTHKVADIGMSVSITDNAGRSIPSNKISQVELDVSYSANTDISKYGYEVSAAANKNPVITMTQSNDGTWVPDSNSNYTWQYVGEYKVTKLAVIVAGEEKDFAAEENGVPAMYTITSKGPTADNLEINSATQNATVFGKTGNSVTGGFLATYGPSVVTTLTWKEKDVDGHQYAKVPGVSVTVDYLYQDGTNAPYGGYSWTGSTGFESWTDTAETPVNNGLTYVFTASGSHPLLAGRYRVTGTLHWTENGTAKSKSIGTLQDISAFSVSPEITVTGISKTGNVTVNKNGNGNGSDLTANASTFIGANRFGDHYAVVYMEYAVSNQTATCAKACGKSQTDTIYSSNFADYTVPSVTLNAKGISSYGATLNITDNGSNSAVTLTDNGSKIVPIGYIEAGSNDEYYHQYTEGGTCSDETTHNCHFNYTTETAHILNGVQVISTVTTKVGNATFVRNLAESLTLSQTNRQSPKLTIGNVAGLQIAVKEAGNIGVTSGSMVDGYTELTVAATASQGYYNPRMSAPSNAIDWTVVNEGENVSTYSCRMAFDDMTLSGTTAKYSTVSYADSSYASVRVLADDRSIASGIGVKPGTLVTVRLTAKDIYCTPYADAANATLTKTSSTDYVTEYTFTMPGKDVTIGSPSANPMRTVSWENTTSFSFSAIDVTKNGRTVENGDYIVPGHKIRVTITADGGTNPALTQPASAVLYAESNAFTRQYDFNMPDSNVALAGTADPYPELSYGNSYADVAITSSGMSVDTSGTTKKGVKPGNTVVVTLTASAGYYAPRMSQPAGVSYITAVGTPGNTVAAYSFTMPNSAVDISSCITATDAPTVEFRTDNTTMSAAAVNYDGSAVASSSGMRVQPGQKVTVTVDRSGDYYNPVLTSEEAELSDRSPAISSSTGYDQAVYTFEMGIDNVVLSSSATEYPTLKITNSNTTITALVGGSNKTATLQVKPGTAVSVSCAAATNYYNAMVEVSGGKTFSAAATQAFSMPTSDVELKGSATKKTLITVSNGDNGSNVSFTMTEYQPDGSTKVGTISNGAYVEPGHIVKITDLATKGSYKNAKVSVSGATYSGGQFTVGTSAITVKKSCESNSSGCIASGTLVTLADGSYKLVEDITMADTVLAFNHETGKVEPAAINFLEDDGWDDYTVINLAWSNGTTSRIIYEHGFFDLDSMKYVYIHEDDYEQYIGHRFYTGVYEGGKYTSGEVALVNAYLTKEYAGCYSFPSVYHLNFFMDDMLSMPGGIAGMFNIFEYGTDLKYDEERMAADIAAYGLFDYENVSEYMTYDTFCTYPAQYLNVSMGKGLMTEEDLEYLIARYAVRYEHDAVGTAAESEVGEGDSPEGETSFTRNVFNGITSFFSKIGTYIQNIFA